MREPAEYGNDQVPIPVFYVLEIYEGTFRQEKPPQAMENFMQLSVGSRSPGASFSRRRSRRRAHQIPRQQAILSPREETMKVRFIAALAGFAIGFVVPTFAQQTNTPDPHLRQQLLALAKKFDEALNNKDAAALAALYTEDAVIVRNDGGPIYGREAIEKYWADVFLTVHYSEHMSRPEQYSPHLIGTWGNQVWSTGEFTETLQVENGGPRQIKGHWLDS
jgi:ketosteroid isomerase-like protein